MGCDDVYTHDYSSLLFSTDSRRYSLDCMHSTRRSVYSLQYPQA